MLNQALYDAVGPTHRANIPICKADGAVTRRKSSFYCTINVAFKRQVSIIEPDKCAIGELRLLPSVSTAAHFVQINPHAHLQTIPRLNNCLKLLDPRSLCINVVEIVMTFCRKGPWFKRWL